MAMRVNGLEKLKRCAGIVMPGISIVGGVDIGCRLYRK